MRLIRGKNPYFRMCIITVCYALITFVKDILYIACFLVFVFCGTVCMPKTVPFFGMKGEIVSFCGPNSSCEFQKSGPN
jgi:hypothetical protein